MEQRILEQILAQGPFVAGLCFALYWLNGRMESAEGKADQRISAVEKKAEDCEKDRLRLWSKLARLIPHSEGEEEEESNNGRAH